MVTSRGDVPDPDISPPDHMHRAGAAVRVRVAPAAAGTPGRWRRRTDARPGALTAGGETAMVRSRGATPKRASGVSSVDRGPRPRTGPSTQAEARLPRPTGPTHEIPRSTHAGRLSITVVARSTAPAAGCARDTATVTTVSPDERQSETDSARRPGSDICELHTHLTCDMRVKMTYACHKLTIFMCAAWHRMRTGQLAMALAASHRALPPHEAHRAVPTAKCVSRPAQDRTHDHAVGALLLHACHECPRSHRALRALNRQTRRRPRRYPRRHVRRLSQLPGRHPGPVSIPATRPPPRNIRPVRQRPPAVRPHHCAARITRITRHPLSRQRHPPRS